MSTALKDFLIVLAGAAGVLGVVFIGLNLTLGEVWINSHADLVFTHGLYLLLIPPIAWAVRYREQESKGFKSPSVRVVLESGLIIVEPADWMGLRMTVSIYRFQDEVEQFVLSAYVQHVQSNGLIQLVPLNVEREEIDTKRLSDMKEALLIKPGQHHD